MTDASSLLRKPIIHIESSSALDDYCDKWKLCRLLAIDTEFMRVDTYYPIAAVIQVSDGNANYLIDPLLIDDWSSLGHVMTSEKVIKVFHACSEDLDVFNNLLGVLPVKLFDTQIAAAFLGLGASVGYGNLVKECLGVVLPKGETRSNWLARPLSLGQIHYAALDVDYLFDLALQLEKKLQEFGREPWAYEESQALIENYVSNLDPASGFYKSNNTWRLSPKNLILAKKIFEWRENIARQKNTPKSRILKDPQIFDVLARTPTSLAELKSIGLHDSAIRKFGQAIIEILKEPTSEGAGNKVVACDMPLTKPEREKVKILRQFVTDIAQKKAIAPEILVKKSVYQGIVRTDLEVKEPLLALLSNTTGWRQEFFKAL